MEEIWKDISNYEGSYQVSNLGNVKSLNRYVEDIKKIQFIKGKILKPFTNGKGYQVVSLLKNGKRKNYYIHRLVAQAFINNPNNLLEINHKDLNKNNNCVNNLEWVTRIENIKHYNNTEIAKKNYKKIVKKRNRKYKKILNNKEEIILEKYKSGLSIDKIRKETKICYNNIIKILKKRNLNVIGNKIRYSIIQKDKDGNVINIFNDYDSIFNYISKSKISNANKDTIRHEIYDAINLRRGTNYKYGYIWIKNKTEN